MNQLNDIDREMLEVYTPRLPMRCTYIYDTLCDVKGKSDFNVVTEQRFKFRDMIQTDILKLNNIPLLITKLTTQNQNRYNSNQTKQRILRVIMRFLKSHNLIL